ncbi:MAG: alpha/beta fold hydrolase [Weeksellaceae bacterium]|nr:alpha/beta fold hydrolase [Weeksellaceae bacterium]
MNKILLKIFSFFLGIVLLAFTLIYFYQEKLIFHPTKLPKDYTFRFNEDHEEISILTEQKDTINSLYFYAKEPKGVIYFLHGNSGDLSSWGDVAPHFTRKNYNVFMIDYRGFGKSGGKIFSENQFLNDAQVGYDFLKTLHPENEIIILGYSIGSGPASYLASKNNPRNVVLASPFYSFKSLAKEKIPFLPIFILKYPLESNQYLKESKAPITIFHGDEDQLIPIHHAKKLTSELKNKNVNFYPIIGQGHNGILKNYSFLNKMDSIMN